MKQWYTATVFEGQRLGRTLGFPTVNLDSAILPIDQKEGVYAAFVKHNNTIFHGALFFGSRVILGETNRVLEIFILDFDKEIYGETIQFQLKDFVRGVENFSSMEKMKTQLTKDITKIKQLLSSSQ